MRNFINFSFEKLKKDCKTKRSFLSASTKGKQFPSLAIVYDLSFLFSGVR